MPFSFSSTKKDSEGSEKELKELLALFRGANKIRYIVFFGFSVFTIFLNIAELLQVPWRAVFILIILCFLAAVNSFILSKTKIKNKVVRASVFYLIFQTIELIFILELLYSSAIMPLIGALIITSYLFLAYFSYTRELYRIIIIAIALVGYATVIILGYLGMLPYHDIYSIGSDISRNRGVFVANLAIAVPVMIIIISIANYFSRKLKQSFKELTKKERELEEAKEVLEIKVAARTKELKELAGNLEDQVEKRTKELQEKMTELERFNKLAVGRELKMIELKKEIKNLKKG